MEASLIKKLNILCQRIKRLHQRTQKMQREIDNIQ